MIEPFDYDSERKTFHATIPADNGHCDYVMQGWMTRARIAAERERLRDLLRRCLAHVEQYDNLRTEIEAALAKWEER